MDKDVSRYKTLKDFGRIISLFENTSGGEISVGDIAKSLQMLPSKVSRMLKTLDSETLFEKNHETGRYRIGARFLQLGLLYTLSHPLRRIILPHLEHMSMDVGLVMSWAIFRSHRVIVVDRVGIKQSLNLHPLGLGPPLHSSSYGKLFLAYLPSKERDRILQSLDFIRFTSLTISDLRTMEDELKQVREKGYAQDRGETREDIQSMSAPIRDEAGDIIAAISIGATKTRFSIENFSSFADSLTDKALFISRQLGYVPGTFIRDEKVLPSTAFSATNSL